MRQFGLVVAVVVVAALLPAVEARAASCSPAGGQAVRRSAPRSASEFVFVGSGFGHGVGMSQYGAQGAARLGCSVTEILTHYYQGVAVSKRDTSANIRVGLVPDSPSANLATVATIDNTSGQDLTWKLERDRVATQPAGARWQVRVTDSGAYRLVDTTSGPHSQVWRGGGTTQSLKLHLDGAIVDYVEKGHRYRYGTIEFRSERRSQPPPGGGSRAGMYVTIDVPNVETYLYGLAEMPSSFPVAALQAQAVVGRSYALANRSGNRANCRCHLYDSTSSQVYAGWDKQAEGPDRVYGRRWTAAVDDTARKVITYDGAIATGFYSSSHGGHTSSGAYIFGGGAPYLQPVEDSRWDRASSDPNITWQTRFTREEVGRAFGVGLALDVALPDPKDAAGRIGDPDRGAGGVVVTGTQGRTVVSGSEARRRLGLVDIKSTLFTVSSPPSPIFTGRPLVGDWDGDGTDQPGWYDDGTFYLRMSERDIVAFTYGSASDRPVVGDWDGDGTDTVGVVRGNRWYLANRHNTGRADIAFRYGSRRDRPVTGDWNRDGADTAGVVRGNRWLLTNRHRGGDAGLDYAYGSPGDTRVVGDWDGDRRVTAGVVRGARWYLANRHGARGADTVLDLSGG